MLFFFLVDFLIEVYTQKKLLTSTAWQILQTEPTHVTSI